MNPGWLIAALVLLAPRPLTALEASWDWVEKGVFLDRGDTARVWHRFQGRMRAAAGAEVSLPGIGKGEGTARWRCGREVMPLSREGERFQGRAPCADPGVELTLSQEIPLEGFADLWADRLEVAGLTPGRGRFFYHLHAPGGRAFRWRLGPGASALATPPEQGLHGHFYWLVGESQGGTALLEVTTADDWATVARRYRALWDGACGEFRADGAATANTPEEMAAWMGREFAWAYAPAPGHHQTPLPCAETWRNRRGDCKDQTQLAATLLRDKGVTAYPVLVAGVAASPPPLPNPFLFHHAILAWERDGATHLLDLQNNRPWRAAPGTFLVSLRDQASPM